MYICENQDGFVLLSSINHRRISVFTYFFFFFIYFFISDSRSIYIAYNAYNFCIYINTLHNQLSTRLACTAQVASVIQPYIVLILTEVLHITG